MGRLRAEEEDQDDEEDVNEDDDDDSDNSDDGDMDQDDDCKFLNIVNSIVIFLVAGKYSTGESTIFSRAFITWCINSAFLVQSNLIQSTILLATADNSPTGGFLLSDASGSGSDNDTGEVDDDIMDALNAISSDDLDEDDDDEGRDDQDNDSWEDISVEEENL